MRSALADEFFFIILLSDWRSFIYSGRISGRFFSSYLWKSAQSNAAYHKHRQPGNRTVSKELIKEVVYLLTHYQWSPKQISGYLKLQGKHISHETIYKIIRKDKKQGGNLYRFCRHKLKHRSKPVGGKRVVIPNRTSISLRPKEADGKRFGDFEMDTIVGKGNHGAILTIVERNTNMLFMRKLRKGKNARELAKNVVWMLSPYKKYIKTITTDNGTEFACHERAFFSPRGGRAFFSPRRGRAFFSPPEGGGLFSLPPKGGFKRYRSPRPPKGGEGLFFRSPLPRRGGGFFSPPEGGI